MKKTFLGLVMGFISLASCNKYWSGYQPLSNFHGTRREYTPFEKRLYSISGTADRDCGGEMTMCYEVKGQAKEICAMDVNGRVEHFPNMCEMLYSNCIMDKENWRYTDFKKCYVLARRFMTYDDESPSETSSISPYRAEMVKNMPQYWETQPKNYPYPGAEFPQNAVNNGYQINPVNHQPYAAYPYRQPYGAPISSKQQRPMSPPYPNIPYQFPYSPSGNVPYKNNPYAAYPPLAPINAPPNFANQMRSGYMPRQPPNYPPIPAGFAPPGFAPQKFGYDPKMYSGDSQYMSPGSLPQQRIGYGQPIRTQTSTNINQSLQINQSQVNINQSAHDSLLRQDNYGFPQFEMLLKMMSNHHNMTARDSIRSLIELYLKNTNETVSVELQDQIINGMEMAYNNSDYKDVHKYISLFNAPMRESQPTARRGYEVEMGNMYKDIPATPPPSTNMETGSNKYSYKMNANEKEVYDQGVDKPDDEHNDTFVPEIQVPNEYGDIDDIVEDLDIGF